jgi:hypothetical protein
MAKWDGASSDWCKAETSEEQSEVSSMAVAALELIAACMAWHVCSTDTPSTRSETVAAIITERRLAFHTVKSWSFLTLCTAFIVIRALRMQNSQIFGTVPLSFTMTVTSSQSPK